MTTYRGKRWENGETVVLVDEERNGGTGTRRLQHYVRHSPDGFAWGYGGSGPAELARCILIDHLGLHAEASATDPPEGRTPLSLVDRIYQSFKEDLVATAPQDEDFKLSADDIANWLAVKAQHDDNARALWVGQSTREGELERAGKGTADAMSLLAAEIMLEEGERGEALQRAAVNAVYAAREEGKSLDGAALAVAKAILATVLAWPNVLDPQEAALIAQSMGAIEPSDEVWELMDRLKAFAQRPTEAQP